MVREDGIVVNDVSPASQGAVDFEVSDWATLPPDLAMAACAWDRDCHMLSLATLTVVSFTPEKLDEFAKQPDGSWFLRYVNKSGRWLYAKIDKIVHGNYGFPFVEWDPNEEKWVYANGMTPSAYDIATKLC